MIDEPVMGAVGNNPGDEEKERRDDSVTEHLINASGNTFRCRGCHADQYEPHMGNR